LPVARQLGAIQTRVFGDVSNVSKSKLIAWVGENRQTALTVLGPQGPQNPVDKAVQTGSEALL
jgi:hypothetical protein